MIVAGCDIGSLTAKAVILKDSKIIASEIISVKESAQDSAMSVVTTALASAGLALNDISACCTTGYGRKEISFKTIDASEISCHGAGAHFLDKSIRTIIDIGGQDSKVISIDETGKVIDFIMNDKCAAGTGRCLEVLSSVIELPIEKLGKISLKSKKPVSISNRCSIFMELDVMEHIFIKSKTSDIANGINKAVSMRVASLAGNLKVKNKVCLTGGVSKNIGVHSHLEKMLGVSFTKLSFDPQLTGALGAAVIAGNS